VKFSSVADSELACVKHGSTGEKKSTKLRNYPTPESNGDSCTIFPNSPDPRDAGAHHVLSGGQVPSLGAEFM
jgi:hypothetical protein